jgi:hypothetical protein
VRAFTAIVSAAGESTIPRGAPDPAERGRRPRQTAVGKALPASVVLSSGQEVTMCRNIKTLFNFAPPATDDEIRAASLQFVRKLSGFNSPSKANQAAIDQAVDDIARAAAALIATLVTSAAPRARDVEAERARARNATRFHRVERDD